MLYGVPAVAFLIANLRSANAHKHCFDRSSLDRLCKPRGFLKFPRLRRLREHLSARRRDSGWCCPSWNGRAATERPAGCQPFCRYAPPQLLQVTAAQLAASSQTGQGGVPLVPGDLQAQVNGSEVCSGKNGRFVTGKAPLFQAERRARVAGRFANGRNRPSDPPHPATAPARRWCIIPTCCFSGADNCG